ncbi:MAG TPA: glycosyltransferase family 2 protein [Flavobacteriaceae bacterium]|nr:glycosyltransferase family 2 protein [Flavobacteriaceae bacterium]
MLSILIPVYNYDVSKLVRELHKQGVQANFPFEIFIFDDGSNSPINEKNMLLNNLDKVVFKSLEKNVGLAQNRNLLAESAQYENLLFIDGDSLVRENFLQNYADALQNSTTVIYGGRVHPENYPNKKESLRWKYGKYVEDKTPEERKKKPYNSTLFNNTLIKKQVFEKIGFEKSLTKYGHEDNLFVCELKKRQIDIQHIENPVIHDDIDPNEIFLKKTQTGLDNLKQLCQNGMMSPNYVKLSRLHSSLKKIGLDRPLSWVFHQFEKPMRKNLTSQNPSLFVFTIFRLSYFCKINR